ncbi:hypothetical protein Poli38472_011459 [Pythium oligandrum]|uniref:Alcohol dehydrogenase iron-type/glycerol dehydrogenase GldA domain-containing protein n=1 Tax=Pythium oligandrum TaxID=41045 RepID=A0A8K1CK73_PYTOL|nr:hypothetical protein Poli38472_011459 [Pythium oligandrum]|eukprot:TMW64579.1 hypothetical protein Poli38472_011459 [Pythium oligandrum]
MRLLGLRRALTARHARLCYSTGSGAPLSTRFDADAQQLSASGQPYRVVFGAKTAAEHIGAIARASGIHKMLVVRDRDSGAASRTQYVEFLLMQAGIPCFQYTLKRDCATVKDVDDGVATAVRVGADGVLAFGGGNTMDMARAIALVLANGESAEAYIKGDMGDDLEPAVPHILVPTVAGSGAEMSTEALVLDEDGEVKQSLTSIPIVAQAVVVDPMLAISVPLHQSVHGALTALGQCIESYLLGCDEEAEQVALQGIELIASAFSKPLVEGKIDLKSVGFREQLALASLASGVAAQASGYGAAHAIAVSMGGVSDLPHTQVASAFLPFVFDRYTTLAVDNEGDDFFDDLQQKLEKVCDRLTASSGFQGQSVATWLRYVSQRFNLPDTSSLELEESLINGLVDRAVQRQEQVMAERDEGAILEKDDIRAIIDSAVVLTEPKDKPTQDE